MATIAEQVMANDPSFTRSPLAKYCVQNYLSNDALFNLVNFVPINVAVQNATAFKYSYSIRNINAKSVGFRAIGEEYKKGNNIQGTADVSLKILGGNFEVDEEQAYALVPGSASYENYVDSQMRDKGAELLSLFNESIVKGDSSKNPKEFDGLEKLVPATRTATQVITTGDFSDAALRIAWTVLYSVIDAVPGANLIITTMPGLTAFRSLLATRNLQLASAYVMTAASAANNTPGLPVHSFDTKTIIGLPREDFSETELAKGEPFYVLRSDSNHGFKMVTPAGRPIVVAKVPNVKAGNTTQHQGGLSMHCAPVIEDLYACAKGYISNGSAPIVSLNSVTPRESGSGAIADDAESESP